MSILLQFLSFLYDTDFSTLLIVLYEEMGINIYMQTITFYLNLYLTPPISFPILLLNEIRKQLEIYQSCRFISEVLVLFFLLEHIPLSLYLV